MACVSPLKLVVKHTGDTVSVPCGRCINCIISNRQDRIDRCDQEAVDCCYQMSYVTVTYDKWHLPYVNDFNGRVLATLVPKHAKQYVDTIRHYLEYNHLYTGEYGTCTPIQRGFRYLVCGEYGDGSHKKRAPSRHPLAFFPEGTPRPHYHFVFFGLNHRACEKIFRKCWRKGISVKVLPVKGGCFRYILSYLNKQCDYLTEKVSHGYGSRKAYAYYNLIKPFVHTSPRFGYNLYLKQWKFIEEHNYMYKSKRNRLRSLPAYFKRIARVHSYFDPAEARKEFMVSQGKYGDFTFKEYYDTLCRASFASASNKVISMRNHGEAVDDSFMIPAPRTSNMRAFVDDALG